MAESKTLETLVYCLGPIGGQDNPVYTRASAFTSKYDYTTNGYARYIEEANNTVQFQYLVLNYFLESVISEIGEDPLAFIDEDSEEMEAAIDKMKKQWRDMFKDHQKKLRESLRNPKQSLEEGSGSSSAKMIRLGTGAASASPSATKSPDSGVVVTSEVGASRISLQSVQFPENIFIRKAKEFGRVLKAEYQGLKTRLGKALGRFSVGTVHDIKGFAFHNMETFTKWKYDLKTIGYLITELESLLSELDLDFEVIKENEDRLTKWLYFDDGIGDRKYHHRLLITMDLTVSIDEISALAWKLIRRWKKLSKSLASKLPSENEAFEAKVKKWKKDIVTQALEKRALKVQKSIESDDTAYNVDEMPEET